MKDFNVPQGPCPHCGAELNGALNPIDDHAPAPGDATICLECAEWSIFTEDLHLRLPTPEEMNDLPPPADLAEAAVLESWRER